MTDKLVRSLTSALPLLQGPQSCTGHEGECCLAKRLCRSKKPETHHLTQLSGIGLSQCHPEPLVSEHRQYEGGHRLGYEVLNILKVARSHITEGVGDTCSSLRNLMRTFENMRRYTANDREGYITLGACAQTHTLISRKILIGR